jgi:hypothetical protein
LDSRKFEIGDSVMWQSQGETQLFRIARIVGDGDSAWIWGKQGESDEISMVVPAREVRRVKDA